MRWFSIIDYNKYIGLQSGKLKIIKVERNYKEKTTYAISKCECGNIIKTKLRSITSGDRKSCGCIKPGIKSHQAKNRLNLCGFKIGKITVTTPTNKRAKNGAVMWNYKCECGNTGIACGVDIKRGQILSCGCKRREYRNSKYEMIVENFLITNKIEYIKEYRFDNCRNKNPLPFDFYLPKHNICIECQGQQHYHAVKHFGGEENYKKITYRDTIKKNYCKSNSIKLIYIPYTLNEKEIQLYLSKKLTP